MYYDDSGESGIAIIVFVAILAIAGCIWGVTRDYSLVGNISQDAEEAASHTQTSSVPMFVPPGPDIVPAKQDFTAPKSKDGPFRKNPIESDPQADSELSTSSSQHVQSTGLTTGDRIVNGIIGFFLGAAIGGAIVACGGAAAAVFAGASLKTFAAGAAIYNISASIFMPFLDIEPEMIELTP